MNLLEYFVLPLISLIVLFLLTKLMGYRQVTELSLYDYIIGITIGSIAAEMVMGSFNDILKPLIGMIVYGYIGLTEKLIEEIKSQYPEPLKVVSTGGLGRMIYQETNLIDVLCSLVVKR